MVRVKLQTDHGLNMVPIPGHPGAKQGTCTIKVEDVPQEWNDYTYINPRSPTKTGVFTKILDTLRNHPGEMVTLNGGLIVVTDRLTADDDDDGVDVVLDDLNSSGIVDGGHTYAACLQAREEASEGKFDLSKAHLNIKFMTGIKKEEAFRIAAAQNTRKTVQLQSLMDQVGKFDQLREGMVGKPGFEQIRYHEGDTGHVPVKEVVQMLNSFNLDLYSPVEADVKKAHPSEYGRATKSLRLWDERGFHPDGTAKPKSGVALVAGHAHEILQIRDWISQDFKDSWNADGKQFGKLKFNGKASTEFVTKLWFIGKLKETQPRTFETEPVVLNYGVLYGMIVPILAAFRANVNYAAWRDGEFRWYAPIRDVFEATIDELVATFRAIYRQYDNVDGSKFNLTTKDKPVHFKNHYDVVVKELLTRGIALPKPNVAKRTRRQAVPV